MAGDDVLVTYTEMCPASSSFYAWMGIAAAMAFSCLGSAYGTAKAGVGVMSAGLIKPSAAMKNTLPVIMAGILGIYGLLTSIAIMANIGDMAVYPLYNSYAQLAAGLCTGFTSLSAGIALGVCGNAGVRAVARKPRLFVVMLLILVLGEALAIYGLIVSLILALKAIDPAVYCV
ncbi:V-ATPase proteolipid subunit C, eukaryotic [Kipferlia bialata]|uniref:V-type proton ATPase proteolipid subunit n=1 Tax=Kipferlia bialata TaxID=797122 RepID=A0A9K3GJ48_9EUKA|nr:V-ATPase proteolipid subunit C, eukaryotic [Kipferlia bialata]|eukprot:g5541.t1